MIIEHIMYIMHILHIWKSFKLFFRCVLVLVKERVCVCVRERERERGGVPSGFDDRMAIFKAAADYSLTDDELEEILSYSDVPVLTAYIDGIFRAAVRLWTFIMPREAKDFFQTEVFHPASLDPNLQKHLGMTPVQRILDM